jgi:protein disulfide-isomerase A6
MRLAGVLGPLAAAAALALLPAGASAGMYPKNSPVLQVDAKSFDRLIAKSNYTSIVEFYAPWCGHCQNLKPAYEKAARSLAGLATVAAVDCDDDANKPLCAEFGIRGFPTLKVLRPSTAAPKKSGGKKAARPSVEDYQGPRTAAGIAEHVLERINNHVVKVTDADADAFVAPGGGDDDGPRALVFTEKGKTTPLLKSLAIEFLGALPVGQVRKSEARTVERFGVTRFPTLVLLPGGGAAPEVYDGEMKKPAMVEFLSKAAAPASSKEASKSKEKAASKEKPSADTASSSSDDTATAKPAVVVADIPPIPTLSADETTAKCLGAQSSTCVLVLLPPGESAHGLAHKALATLAGSAHRHARANAHFLPFYAAAHDNAAAAALRDALALDGDVEVVAINGRRGWWRRYVGEGSEAGGGGSEFGTASVEAWIDSIRMGDGVKSRLPEGVVRAVEEEKTAAPAEEGSASSSSEPTAQASDDHDEL